MNTRNSKNNSPKRTPKKPSKAVPARGRAGRKSADIESGKKTKAKDRSKYIDFKDRVKKGDPLPSFNENEVRLNKYLSNAGVCSRRDADVLIQTGVVQVNGVIVTEMGDRKSVV